MTSRPALLLCTDMDRTLLPNGEALESPAAMPYLKKLVAYDDIQLAYVTGRDRDLVQQAIVDYLLPMPNYVIGDVGTSIYTIDDHGWRLWDDWHEEIAYSWRGLSHDSLHDCLRDISSLCLQEDSKQNKFKLSYYAAGSIDANALQDTVRKRLQNLDLDCTIIWSIDESRDQGLLDILPAAASKYHAVDYLLRQTGCGVDNTLFAGDSGNDIDVLSSPLRAVLVANATNEVRQQAGMLARQRGQLDALYLARGGQLGMNGNYAAGILEGVVHYYPELLHRILEENVPD